MEAGTRAGPARPAAHPRQDGAGASARRAPTSRPSRRGCYTMQIPKDKIRDIIGPGGKTIRSIVEETGCEIEVENDGKVIIASPDGEAAKRAIADDRAPHRGAGDRQGLHRHGAPRRAVRLRSSRSCPAPTASSTSASSLPTASREISDVVKEGDELDGQGHRHRRDRPRPALAQGGDHGGARLRSGGTRPWPSRRPARRSAATVPGRPWRRP